MKHAGHKGNGLFHAEPLLQVRRLHGKLELRVKLVEEEGVGQRLSHLHDADDGSVDLVLAVLENALFRRLLLVVRLFQLYLEIGYLDHAFILCAEKLKEGETPYLVYLDVE